MSEQTAVEAPVRGRSRSTVRSRLHRIDSKTAPYLYVSPFFVLFGAFGLFPLGYTAWVAMTNRTLLDPNWSYVGLDNFAALIHDSYFWNAVENTLAIFLISTIPQLLFAPLGRADDPSRQLDALRRQVQINRVFEMWGQ